MKLSFDFLDSAKHQGIGAFVGVLFLYIFAFILLFIGFCGNLFSIITILCTNLIRNPINKYILIMLIFDLIVDLRLVLLNLDGSQNIWFCWLLKYIMTGPLIAGSNIIVLLTIERLFAIFYPLKHMQYKDVNRWIIIFVFLFPFQLWALFIQSAMNPNDIEFLNNTTGEKFRWKGQSCTVNKFIDFKLLNIPFYLSVFILPFFFVFFANIAIIFKLQCCRRIYVESTSTCNNSSSSSNNNNNNKVLFILPLIYAAVSLPLLFILIENHISGGKFRANQPFSLQILIIAICVMPYFFTNFLFNWLFYAISSTFRTIFVQFWSTLLGKAQNSLAINWSRPSETQQTTV